MENLVNLFNFKYITPDRRKQSSPVENDNRSGIDRRGLKTPVLNPILKNDIVDLKNSCNFFITKINSLDEASKKDPKKEHKKEIGKYVALGVAGIIPQVCRMYPVLDSFKNGDIIKCLGKWTVGIVNFKADNIDIKDGIDQIKNKAFYIHDVQVPWSFLRNTSLENKESKIIQKIAEYDKTLFELKYVRKILNFLNIKYEKIYNSEFDKLDRPIIGYKFLGNPVKRVIGRALTRVTIIGLALNILFEIPAIVRARKDHKIKKQTLKSGVSVFNNALFSSIIGSAGAFLGPIGSLIGIGLGFWIAGEVTEKEAKTIDQTF